MDKLSPARNALKNLLKFLGARNIHESAETVRRIFLYPSVNALAYAMRLLNRKTPGRAPAAPPRKILLIRIDRLGDMVLSAPAIRAVRTSFPAGEIHIITAAYTSELAALNPDVNRCLVDGRDIIEQDYDMAIALHPGIRPNYLTFKSGAPVRVGFSGLGGEGFLTRALSDDRLIMMRHEVESTLEAVTAAGCATASKELEIRVTKEGEQFAEEFFKQRTITPGATIVMIHPGSRQSYIRWKKEHFAEVADRLAREHAADIFILGGKGEEELVTGVSSLMKTKTYPVTGLSLTQLVSVIKRCRIFIGNSTGPMHMASALKVPVVALFGSRHPRDSASRWAPWQTRSIVLQHDPGCPACHPTNCRDYRCMDMITPGEVLKAAEKLISGDRN